MLRAPLILAAFMIAGCHNASDAPVPASEAIRRANADFTDTLPQVPLEMMTVEARDEGDHWRVIYRPPEGSTGDPLSIIVDKHSGTVVQGLRGPNYIEAD